MLTKFKKYIQNPNQLVYSLGSRGLLNFVPDKLYLEYLFKARTGMKLNLENPQTFNEKLQWLKLYDRNPEYTDLVDKYTVRNYIAKTIGEEYLIPLIGVWETFDEINFDDMPNQFVLKTTHDSGGVVICKNKKKFNSDKAKKILNKSLKTNYYYSKREWPYKNVKPRIIAERYMIDESGYELKDYKFFCFNGKPEFLQVDFDRESNHQRNMYDLNWNFLEFKYNYPNDRNKKIHKPLNLKKMIKLAETLSTDIPFARVDLYSINEQIYFGEITFYPLSGYGKFQPDYYDEKLGHLLDLNIRK